MQLLPFFSLLVGALSLPPQSRKSPEHNPSTQNIPTCGWKLDESFLEFSRAMAMAEQDTVMAETEPEMVTISVYVHLVARGFDVSEGFVEKSDVENLIEIINTAYVPLGFEFKLQGYTRTIDATFSDITREEYNSTALDERLYMGDLETLNVYIHQSLGGLGGFCSVPIDGGEQSVNEGCRLAYDVVPPTGNGRVAIHEIGHWLGLGHTFQERPSGANESIPLCDLDDSDGIEDTAVHLCPLGYPDDDVYWKCKEVKSCPGRSGKLMDPNHNYMSYLSTACLSEFTPGQVKRMHSSWESRKRTNANSKGKGQRGHTQ